MPGLMRKCEICLVPVEVGDYTDHIGWHWRMEQALGLAPTPIPETPPEGITPEIPQPRPEDIPAVAEAPRVEWPTPAAPTDPGSPQPGPVA